MVEISLLRGKEGSKFPSYGIAGQLGHNSNDRPDGSFLPEAEIVARGYSVAYGFGSLDFDVDDDGISHVSVWGRTAFYNETFYYVDNSSGAWNWTSYGAGYPDTKKMAVDDDGNNHFCWNAGRTLYYGRDEGPGTTMNPEYTAAIASVASRWAVASMAVDPEGFAHIIWTSTSGGELLYTSNSSGEFSPVQTLSPPHAGAYSISTDAWGSSHVCFTTSADLDVTYITDADYSIRPRITTASPSSAYRGETLDVEIVGANTSFENGVSQAAFSGEGITVNSTTVLDSTRATANITIDPDAPPGHRNVNVITGDERPARLGRGLTLYPAMVEVNSSVTSLAEVLFQQDALAENVNVTGDLGGTMSLGFNALRIGSGSFDGRGFFKGQWDATLETAPYAGDWKGTFHLNEAKGTITLRGTFSGHLGGIAEAVISESTPGSGSYDSYQATWKINRVGNNSTYAVLQQEGAIGWSTPTSHPATGIRVLQGFFSGEGAAGGEILPMSAVLTHLEVSEEASPYVKAKLICPLFDGLICPLSDENIQLSGACR